MKEATRTSAKASGQSTVTNGRGDGSGPTIPPPSTMMSGTSPYSARSQIHGGQDEDHRNSNEANVNSTLIKGVTVAHQRSQSLTAVAPGGVATNTESPKHGATAGKPDLIGQSPEAQLKYENERLRLALAQRLVKSRRKSCV